MAKLAPEAAAPAAAEGDPRVGAGRLIEEALGPERVGVGVDLGVVMDQVGVRDQADAGRIGPAADLDRLLDQPRRGVGQHRPAAQRLVDRGRQVRVAVAARRPPRRAAPAPRASAPAARTPRPARTPSSRGRRPAASSARRAAPGRTSASRPRGGPRAASRGRRRARRPRARRSSISSKISASASSRMRTKRAHGPRPPTRAGANGSMRSGRLPNSSIVGEPLRAARRAARPASSPKTARRITSSVSAWRRG